MAHRTREDGRPLVSEEERTRALRTPATQKRTAGSDATEWGSSAWMESRHAQMTAQPPLLLVVGLTAHQDWADSGQDRIRGALGQQPQACGGQEEQGRLGVETLRNLQGMKTRVKRMLQGSRCPTSGRERGGQPRAVASGAEGREESAVGEGSLERSARAALARALPRSRSAGAATPPPPLGASRAKRGQARCAESGSGSAPTGGTRCGACICRV